MAESEEVFDGDAGRDGEGEEERAALARKERIEGWMAEGGGGGSGGGAGGMVEMDDATPDLDSRVRVLGGWWRCLIAGSGAAGILRRMELVYGVDPESKHARCTY